MVKRDKKGRFVKGRPSWNKGKKYPNIQKEKHYNWKGGKIIQNGYVYVLSRDHPKAKFKKGYVSEHVLVMEKKMGRYLNKGECVHHIDEDPTNNKISNLILFCNHREHMIACHEHKNGRKKGKFKRRY